MDVNQLHTLVLGASSTIGISIVKKLAPYRPLILHGRDISKLHNCIRSIEFVTPPEIWIKDLSEVDTIQEELIAFIQEKSLLVNSLVHCAAVLCVQPIKTIKLSSMQQSINVNFLSFALIVRVLLHRSMKSSLKNIIIISSNVSNRGAKAFSIYAATKGALDAMMRCLAVELAPQVRVNSILPGAIMSSMTDDLLSDKDVAERMQREYPLGFGSPENIADMVDFLLSEKAQWITGQQITIDGGRSINISG